MQVDIGMKRVRWQQVASDLQAQVEAGGDIDISIYTHDGEVHLSNDDMERDDVDANEVYVDITE